MSDLDRFELFIYVAQASSLTQAAQQLGLTKTALSKQIKRLENDLQIDLFSRHRQRLSLTKAGEVFLTQCLRLKKELDDTRNLSRQFIAEPTGMLNIVVFEYFANKLIFPKLNDFLQRYPKLQLAINIKERVPDFEREQVDLAVGFSLPAPDEIIRKSMMTTRYVLCGSSNYLTAHGTPTHLASLRTHLYIGHQSRPENMTINLKSPHQLILKPYLLLNNVSAMIECAKRGLGLIQLPLYLVGDLLKTGELIEVLSEYQADNRNVYYYYPRYRYTQPKVRKFIEFFLQSE